MLSKTDAEALVLEQLKKFQSPDHPIAISQAKTIERPFGWIFFYNTRKYLETGNVIDGLAGNWPFLVNKYNGSVVVMRSDQSVNDFIGEYEHSLRL
jgi:hypothetical protein